MSSRAECKQEHYSKLILNLYKFESYEITDYQKRNFRNLSCHFAVRQ